MGEFSLSRAGTSFTFGDRGVGLDGAGDEGEGAADGGGEYSRSRARNTFTSGARGGEGLNGVVPKFNK